METFTFRCEECSCSFDPSPDMVVEVFWQGVDCAEDEDDDDMEGCLTAEELEIASAEDLAGIGLTCADRDALLAGQKVPGGAAIICCGCQDRLASEA